MREKLEQIERQVGKFSSYHVYLDGKPRHAGTTTLEERPSYQMLGQLGSVPQKNEPLSTRSDGTEIPKEGNADVTLNVFGQEKPLTISGKRLDRLARSAKVYVNTDVVDRDAYVKAVKNREIQAQDSEAQHKGQYWMAMASSCCHVQEVDLLTQFQPGEEAAIHHGRVGEIRDDEQALVLLSTPALHPSVLSKITREQSKEYIISFYRTLCEATLAEGGGALGFAGSRFGRLAD